MSDFLPTLVLQKSIAKSPNDMAKVQIKPEKLSPFGGIFSVMEQFDALLALGGGRLPKSFKSQNTVFLLMAALVRNFYKAIMQRLATQKIGLRPTSRVKTFVFKFVSVPPKWIKASRRHVLNIYTDNHAYARLFQAGFG